MPGYYVIVWLGLILISQRIGNFEINDATFKGLENLLEIEKNKRYLRFKKIHFY